MYNVSQRKGKLVTETISCIHPFFYESVFKYKEVCLNIGIPSYEFGIMVAIIRGHRS